MVEDSESVGLGAGRREKNNNFCMSVCVRACTVECVAYSSGVGLWLIPNSEKVYSPQKDAKNEKK